MGNGNKINIWEDHWLPEQNGFKVLSKKPNNNVPIKVSNLINKTKNNWKEPIIHNLFLPFEAFQIKQIPITDTNAEDELVWASSQDGNYSVKTGYYAVKNWEDQSKHNPSRSSTQSDNLSQNLWNFNIPPKQIHLVWRILNNGISKDPLCPRCNSQIESIGHAFMESDWSQRVWFASPLTLKFQNLDNFDFINWLSENMQKKNLKVMELTTSIIYGIWNARNDLVFRDKNLPIHEVLTRSIQETNSYQVQNQKIHHRPC